MIARKFKNLIRRRDRANALAARLEATFDATRPGPDWHKAAATWDAAERIAEQLNGRAEDRSASWPAFGRSNARRVRGPIRIHGASKARRNRQWAGLRIRDSREWDRRRQSPEPNGF